MANQALAGVAVQTWGPTAWAVALDGISIAMVALLLFVLAMMSRAYITDPPTGRREDGH